jgi:hypothetical protein
MRKTLLTGNPGMESIHKVLNFENGTNRCRLARRGSDGARGAEQWGRGSTNVPEII